MCIRDRLKSLYRNNFKYLMSKGVINILKCRKISQFILLIAGVSMMSYGAVRGEAAVVLGKAIKLCLECVGIG